MPNQSPAEYAPTRHEDHEVPYREPLSPWTKRAILASVVFFHVGAGWALTLISPTKIEVGDSPPMEVRMVSEEQPQQAAPPPPPEPEPPPPPELESMIQPPMPDLPPPEFPVDVPPPPPPKPKPPPPRPKQPVQEAAPTPAPPVQAAPAAPAAPRTVSASQVSFIVRPNPTYPTRSRRANEQGTAMVRVLVDTAGRPTNVALEASSGHAALDESAVAAVKAAQFRPFADAGVVQSVWVLVPIRFVLQ